MVLIRNDLLDCLPTPFSGNSSCEIPFAIMFVFQKIRVMHSHLIPRLPGAYENALCHFMSFMLIYSHTYIYINIFKSHTTCYVISSQVTPIYQFWSTITQINSLELITNSSPMTYIPNYIPYNCDLMLIHKVHALTYPFPHKSNHSLQTIFYTQHMDLFYPFHTNPGLFLQSQNRDCGLSVGSPLIQHLFHFLKPISMAISGIILTNTQFNA